MVFTRKEVIDLIVSWLTISVAFAWVLSHRMFGINLGGFVSVMPITLIAVGTGFIFHELAHRFVAIRFGAQAEYRAWSTGLIFALLMSVFGFVFAAPGAVYIFGQHIGRRKNGLISLAGPAANVAIAAIFFPLRFFLESEFLLTIVGFTVYINLFLAAFNLIPIYPLDGSKVFAWNNKIWAAIFIPLVFILLLVV